MDHILILSDDLTGAGDSGVQFAMQGIVTTVCMDERDTSLLALSDAQRAVVIDTETRALDSAEAVAKLREVIANVDLASCGTVFKKIDSTLRGNIAEELQPLLDTGMFEAAIVAPAYPRNGRVTIGGYHLVQARLLEDSELSRDPKYPMKISYIPDILQQQTDSPIGHIDIRALRSGELVRRLDDQLAAGIRIITVDSATDADLQQIVATLMGRNVLWVGSAGLASALAGQLANGDASKRMELPGSGAAAPVLVVAGSLSEVTRGQVAYLQTSGFETVTLDPVELLAADNRLPHWERSTEQSLQILGSRQDLIITIDASESKKQQVAEFVRQSGEWSMLSAGNRIAEQLGRFAAAVIAQSELSGMVLTGGDIAFSTCRQLGIRSLDIIDQVEEGLPLCRPAGSAPYWIVTKAGAFGNEQSLLKSVQKIKQQ